MTKQDSIETDYSTALVPVEHAELTLPGNLTREQIELLKQTICKGATDNDLQLFIQVCNTTRLNPFAKQIYGVQRYDSKLGHNVMTIQISVDGLRVIAQRSGMYAGQIGPEWCLPYNTILETSSGKLQIGDIVKHKLEVDVKSLNLESGLVEWQPVTGYFFNGSTQHWASIHVEGTRHNFSATPNHEVLTERGFEKIDNLLETDKIAIEIPLLTERAKQVLLGSLMGDGGLRKVSKNGGVSFYEKHSYAQEAYLIWKLNELRSLKPIVERRNGTIGFRTHATPLLIADYEHFYDGTKKAKFPWILTLNNLGLAVWIMDDGSIVKGKDCIHPKLTLSTHRYGYDGNVRLKRYFEDMWDVSPTITKQRNHFVLSFSWEHTALILDNIRPYLEFDGTKKWIASNSLCNDLESTVMFMPIREKFEKKLTEVKGRYCIEVANNHNFILSNGVVVKNCGPDGIWKDVWLDDSSFPVAARVGVMRRDFQQPLFAVAKWTSYAATDKQGGLMPMWAKMPDLMLGKVAESNALRRAFPAELSGLYSPEEMAQAENTVNASAVRITEVHATDWREATRINASQSDRLSFQEAIKELGADAKYVCKVYGVTKLVELPSDATFGTIVEKVRTSKEEENN